MAWITGAEILDRERWDGLLLRRAFDNNELCPLRAHDRAILTSRSRCLTCVNAQPQHGYQAVGCPHCDDAPTGIDAVFEKIIKPGIDILRGTVDKAQFLKRLPANLFDTLGYQHDAEFVQFVEGKIGPDHLRAMLIESRCRKWVKLMAPVEMLDRLKAAKFDLADVEEYELRHGLRSALAEPTAANDPGQDQRVEVLPHFATASDLVTYHRGRGVHELHELARLLDEEFTRAARLTDEALGRLLPANPGSEITTEGHKRQGHRLRKANQQNAL